MLNPMVAAVQPSPLWYATRGAGVATLLVLTATTVLGIGTAAKWDGGRTPRFVSVMMHRNLSLLGVVLLVVHIVTTLLDPFAKIPVRDVVVPFGAAYRPIWLGLGVLAAEVIVAITLSSLLRDRIGARLWRTLHWTAYASWPVAVLHGLGTGTDAQAPWLIGVTAACMAAVVVAIAGRLVSGRVGAIPVRMGAAMATLGVTVGIVTWAVHGPFVPGWSIVAGTPTAALDAAAGTPTPRPPAHTGPFTDNLVGNLVQDAQGRAQVSLRDVSDPELVVTVRPQAGTETLPVLTAYRGSRVICSVPVQATDLLSTVCGTTHLSIALYRSGPSITGRLSASGPIS